MSFFLTNIDKIDGFNNFLFIQNFGRYLQNINGPVVADGTKKLADIGRTGKPWWVRLAAVQAMSELKDVFELKASATETGGDAAAFAASQEKFLRDSIAAIKREETDKNLRKIYGEQVN